MLKETMHKGLKQIKTSDYPLRAQMCLVQFEINLMYKNLNKLSRKRE